MWDNVCPWMRLKCGRLLCDAHMHISHLKARPKGFLVFLLIFFFTVPFRLLVTPLYPSHYTTYFTLIYGAARVLDTLNM